MENRSGVGRTSSSLEGLALSQKIPSLRFRPLALPL